MIDAYRVAMKDFEYVLEREMLDSLASIAALFKLRNTLFWTSTLFDSEATARARARELSSELAERLLTHFARSERADNYLVRGIIITTDLDGSWSLHFPEYEVASTIERYENQELILNVPSAFQLFVEDRDWFRAHDIVKARPNGFTTPGLTGWRAVTLANVTPTEAVERFNDAADAFAADRYPDDDDLTRRGGHWSGANQQLWAKFCRARARVEEAMRAPGKQGNSSFRHSTVCGVQRPDGTARRFPDFRC
jgi:hypothetical protein